MYQRTQKGAGVGALLLVGKRATSGVDART